jgi:hypothetical protein
MLKDRYGKKSAMIPEIFGQIICNPEYKFLREIGAPDVLYENDEE